MINLVQKVDLLDLYSIIICVNVFSSFTECQIIESHNFMINNYKYPYYFPQPELLKDQYKYASQSMELNIPLPGYSVKIPFKQQPTRFLTINRKQRQIDYLKNLIQQKVDMQQLHYQARIEQMRRENDYNRQKLQKLLSQQPTNLFQIPDKFTEQGKFISQNLDKLSLQRMNRQKQRYLIDSVDKQKRNFNQKRRNSQSFNVNQEQIDSDEQRRRQQQQKKQRQVDLDYIYKKNGAVNLNNHFGTAPILKKEQQKIKQKIIEKREQYDWVKRVRQARKNKFIQEDAQSVDSSKPSVDSSQQKRRRKQQDEKQKLQKQKQQRERQEIISKRSKQIQRNSPILGLNNKNGNTLHYVKTRGQSLTGINQQKKQNKTYRQKTPQSVAEQTISRQQQISNMSQFSRYAQKNRIFEKEKQKRKQNGFKAYQNIFERDDENQSQRGPIPITLQNKNKKNWKL